MLSLAVLLTIGSEQPSATFLSFVAHIPESWHRHLYDLGNICLLAGILLFPFGQLRPRIVVPFLCLLPMLFFLRGDFYRRDLRRLHDRRRHDAARAPPPHAAERCKATDQMGAVRLLRLFHVPVCSPLTCDMTKLTVGSFGAQLTLELFAGLTFGLAFLSLQLGLLIALMRYRLYDAEVVISRSVNIALITLGVAAVFAATADALKQFVYNYYGNSHSEGPVIFAAALSTSWSTPSRNGSRAGRKTASRGTS